MLDALRWQLDEALGGDSIQVPTVVDVTRIVGVDLEGTLGSSVVEYIGNAQAAGYDWGGKGGVVGAL